MERVPWLTAVIVIGVFSLANSSGEALPLPDYEYRISPGDNYNGRCTLNFIYDGVDQDEGRVFVGTAAHCTEMGESAGTIGLRDFGVTVYANDRNDVALIEVDPEFHEWVVPHVRGHPDMPTGVATIHDVGTGSPLLLGGYGIGFESTSETRENRPAVLLYSQADSFSAAGPAIYGDSGGPVLETDGGGAYGTMWKAIPGVYVLGPTVEEVLRSTSAAGFSIELRSADEA